jgi:hypothetical protein
VNKKQQRKLIYEKSGGLCWYCGCDLSNKKWHADHFYPVLRHPETGKFKYPKMDVVENLVPSCAPCNNFKLASSVEGFRWKVNEQFENTLKTSVGLRQLLRLGLVEFKIENQILFWFEKQCIEMPKKSKLLGIDYRAEIVEWHYDNVESCFCCDIKAGYTLTIRLIKNTYLVILTDCEWGKNRTEFEYQGIENIKLFAVDWALQLIDKS